MNARGPDAIGDAFELLHEKIEARLEEVREDVGEAVRSAVYDRAQQLIDRARELTVLAQDLKAFEARFETLVPPTVELEPKGGPEPGKRMRKGLKTPQEEYRGPILRALAEMGGEADLNRVLERVHELMKGRLNDYDYTCLASEPETPRWRNTAQWARNSLREDGLICDDTPRSVWKMSEKGRQWLAEQKV